MTRGSPEGAGGALDPNFAKDKFHVTHECDAVFETGLRDYFDYRDLGTVEAGCEVPRIAAITLHSIANVHQILETYLVRTYNMAKAAIVKLESYTAAVREARNERSGNTPDPDQSAKT
jgi:hypothetical protein